MSLKELGIGLVASLGTGSVYALLALSFSLVASTTGIFNFALESVASLGTILAYEFLSAVGLSQAIAVLLVLLIGALLGAMMYALIGRPFEGRNQQLLAACAISTVGIAVAFDAVTTDWFGSVTQAVPPYISGTPWELGQVPVRPAYVVMFGVLIVVAGAFHLMSRRTTAGSILRALQLDPTGTSLLGINIRKVVFIVFMLSGLLAAGAGYLITPVTSASSTVGQSLIIPGFAAMVIGGVGQFQGAIVGGMVIGVIQCLVPLYINPAWADPITLLVMAVVLVIKPLGLFSLEGAREV